MTSFTFKSGLARTVAAAVVAMGAAVPAFAWEPAKPVEFVIPAGTGGGADQMARLIQGIIVKHKLMTVRLVVVNKSGGAGAEGFLAMKGAKGDPHKIIISLSNLFTTPMATGVPFSWKDMTPVSMMALDQFVLWTNAEKPYKNAGEYVAAVKAAGPSKMKMAGTGSKQEDQIITVAVEKATGTRFIYVPFKGGGDVAVQLVGNHVDSTVNNPVEAISQWRAGSLKPQCVFDTERMPYTEKVTDKGEAWADVPTCKEAGIDVHYTMLRGIFMSPGVAPEQQKYYVDLMQKVRETPDWKEYMEKGAFKTTSMSGPEFTKWLEAAEEAHRTLMTEAGFISVK